MKVLILAAGYGTRLYPLTQDKPKPLLDIGGKTIMRRLLEKAESVEACNEAFIVTNAKFYGLLEKWKKENSFRFPVSIINDMTTSNEDRLGAIGDINLVFETKKPVEDILMVAGDNLFEFDIRKYVAFAAAKKELSIALYDVNDRELAKKYGIVKIDPAGKIVDFEEKPEEPKSTLASTGIYYLPAGKVQKVREYMSTGNKKDAPGNFVKWLAGTDGAYGFVFTEGWYDIGDIDSYHKADKEYFKKKI